MNRRTALAIAFIGLNLMACCCAGVGDVPKPTQLVAGANPDKAIQQDDENGEVPIRPKKSARAPFVPPPEPNYPAPPKLPAGPPEIEVVLASALGSAKVELLSGSIDRIKFTRNTLTGSRELESDTQLVLKVRVTNQGKGNVTYTPWTVSGKSTMTDDQGAKYFPWAIGPASWIPEFPKKGTVIIPGDSVVDIVAFNPPDFGSEKLEVGLIGTNCGQGEKHFSFRFGRSLFENPAKRKADLDARYDRALKEHDQTVAKMKEDYTSLVARLEKEHADTDVYVEPPEGDYKTERSEKYPTQIKLASGKTVYVQGHFRSDGTYVNPHMRSAPGSGSSKSTGRRK